MRNPALLLFLFCFFSGCALMDRSGIDAPRTGALRENQFRGVFHVHTVYSHDSNLTLRDVIKTARKFHLDFVIITDHKSMDAAGAYRKSALPSPPLLIFGTENTTPDGHLVTLGTEAAPSTGLSSWTLIDWVHEKDGYAVLAHPVSRRTPWTNLDTENFDGLEVYNFAHELFAANRFALGGRLSIFSKKQFLRNFQKRPDEGLKYWDEKLETGKYSAWAAADAHVRHKWLGWRLENERLQFQSVTMVAVANQLNQKEVLEALGLGRSFIAFESRGTALGFSFTAQVQEKIYWSGESVPLGERPVFLIRTPERARIVLVHHGNTVFQYEGREAVFPVEKKGAYRVEVYRDGGLWILSNPIYVE